MLACRKIAFIQQAAMKVDSICGGNEKSEVR